MGVGRKTQYELARVYREHVDFVWRTARRMGMSASEAEDTVHEVFLVVQRRLPELDPERSLVAWLHRITKNIVMHQRRGVARRMRRHRELQPVNAQASDPIGDADTRQLVESALARVDEDPRRILVLADIEGMTAPEIAEALGQNVNTVYSRLRKARMQFEQAVEALSDERKNHHGA